LRESRTTSPQFRDLPVSGPMTSDLPVSSPMRPGPLTYFTDGRTDGYFLSPTCWGTYLHGILDNASIIDTLLAPYTELPGEDFDYRQYKEEQYDKLAALLRQHLAIDEIYKTLQA